MKFELISAYLPDNDQKKIISSSISSKIIWGSAFSGKTLTAVWRATYLLSKNITPIIICFSSHHRRLLRKILKTINLSEKIQVLTFLEWQINCIKSDKELLFGDSVKVLSRDEILLWLSSHLGQFTGNDAAENDLEIIWAEKIFKAKSGEAEYLELLNAYEHFLKSNHAIDEIDLYFQLLSRINNDLYNGPKHFIFDEGHEASLLDIQLIGCLNQKFVIEFFIDYNQGVMSWRTPLGPIPIKRIKSEFNFVKEFYLTNNYINKKNMINLAQKSLKRNKNRISKRAFAINKEAAEVKFYLVDTADEEGAFLRKKIIEKISDPAYSDKKIGVLLRNHKQAYAIADYFDEILPTPYYSNTLMRKPGSQKILSLLRIFCRLANDYDFDVIMNDFFDEQIKNQYFSFKSQLSEKQIYFSYLFQALLFSPNLKSFDGEIYLIERLENVDGEFESFQISSVYNPESFKGFFYFEKLEDGTIKMTSDSEVLKIFNLINQGEGFCFYQGGLSEALSLVPGLSFVHKSIYFEDKNTDFCFKQNFNDITALVKNNLKFMNQLKAILERHLQTWKNSFVDNLNSFEISFDLFKNLDLKNDLIKLNYLFQKNYLAHLTNEENLKLFLKKFRSASTASIELNEKITICTIHESRHQIFDMVVLPRMHQFEFPHGQSCSGEELEEERRLFNLALMRCRDTLLLTSIKKDHAISQFVHEIGIY